jgi:integrase
MPSTIPLVHANVNRYVLEPICEKLKVERGTTHAFRHGRNSQLQQSKVPGDLIKEWVGHTRLKITSGYTHFDEEYVRRTIDELKKKKG